MAEQGTSRGGRNLALAPDVVNQDYFALASNLLVAAIALVVGTADCTVRIGDFAPGGIELGAFAAILLHQLCKRAPGSRRADAASASRRLYSC